MTAFPLNEAVQTSGCMALWNMARTKENRVDLMDAGGLAAVLCAMRLHPHVEGVQNSGCGMMTYMALSMTPHVEEATDAILRAIQTCPDAVPRACTALRVFGAVMSMRPLLVHGTNGMQSILRVMATHLEVARIQSDCCKLLLTVLKEGDFVAGAVKAVLCAMSAHATTPALQADACAVLLLLRKTSEERRICACTAALSVINATEPARSACRLLAEAAADAVWPQYAEDLPDARRATEVLLAAKASLPSVTNAYQATARLVARATEAAATATC